FPAVGLDSGPIRTPASSERQLATFELLPGKTLAQRLVEGDATSDQGIHDEKALSCYHRFYCARGGSCAGCGHVCAASLHASSRRSASRVHLDGHVLGRQRRLQLGQVEV